MKISEAQFLASAPGRNGIKNECKRVAKERSSNRIPIVQSAIENKRATIMVDHLQCQSVSLSYIICIFLFRELYLDLRFI